MKKLLFLLFAVIPSHSILSQENEGNIQGDFYLNAQTYNEDPSINAQKVDEYMLLNSYSNIRYTKGDFIIGLRYEGYLNALQDFDSRYNDNGVAYRFAQYTVNGLEVTLGNFYEQFGNGLIFRSYEEKSLGIDNAMDGIRLKYSPLKGVYLKGFAAKQRFFFDLGEGLVRGFDTEVNMNEAISVLNKSKTNVLFGGSFVSRYQQDNNPVYNLPENVAAYAIRSTINRGKVSFNGEYAFKYNDPAGATSYNNFAPGSAIMTNLSYSQKGLGIIIEAHRIDNMDFRSERAATGKELTLSYIPAISKQHTYTLAAFYPFATQPQGELGFQGEINYTFKKKSTFGGKYGTKVSVNYSRINALNGGPSELNTITDHTPMFFSIKDEDLFFRDFNFEIKKKINKKFKLIANYVDLIYNKDVIQGKNYGKDVHARIGIIDFNYKIKPKHSLRTELQYLAVDKNKKYDEDQGDWMMGLLEYTFSPHWFFAVLDQYNGGYITKDGKSYDAVHYINISCGYSKGTNRFELGYGKKREGIFCVGGVCKNVPSSNGLTLTVTSTF